MNNEYAFPITIGSSSDGNGLTKREWFAGMALQGIMANAYIRDTTTARAETAFRLADAMIEQSKESEKTNQ